jgi:hypothetical protein
VHIFTYPALVDWAIDIYDYLESGLNKTDSQQIASTRKEFWRES